MCGERIRQNFSIAVGRGVAALTAAPSNASGGPVPSPLARNGGEGKAWVAPPAQLPCSLFLVPCSRPEGSSPATGVGVARIETERPVTFTGRALRRTLEAGSHAMCRSRDCSFSALI